LDTLLQIEEILQKRTGKIIFNHCYSHTTDKNNNTTDEQISNNDEKRRTMEEKYGKERTKRYIEGNAAADKLADEGILKKEKFTPLLNKYHNNYIIVTNRKKNLKKHPNTVINTRVRSSIKNVIRNEHAKTVFNKKIKYDQLKENKENINKLSTSLIRSIDHVFDTTKRFMIRMIHGALPTCSKMKRLVDSELTKIGRSYYTEKYGNVTNGGMCPCCRLCEETQHHLFTECTNETIATIREQIPGEVGSVVAQRGDKVRCSTDFIQCDWNENKTPKKWNKDLGNMGLIPHYIIQQIYDSLEDEQKHNIRFIATDISHKIMEKNIEIWKYRCKLLYAADKTQIT